MKTKLIVLGIILALLGVIYFLFGALKTSKKETEIYKKNTYELRKSKTEIANTLILTSKELKKLYPKIDSFAKVNNILTKDLKEIHSIKYQIGSSKTSKTDTIRKDKFIYLETPLNDYQLTWYFDHGCFQSFVNYDPNTQQAIDTLFGEIEINRTISMIRPKFWFWKLKWNKSKWETETKVVSNCPELNIKENTVIKVY